MNKKQYNQPVANVATMRVRASLLAGSGTGNNGGGSTSDNKGVKNDFGSIETQIRMGGAASDNFYIR